MIKNRNVAWLLVLMVLIASLTGCASNYKSAAPASSPESYKYSDSAGPAPSTVTTYRGATNNASVQFSSTVSGQLSAVTENRKVITTGSLSLAVQNLDDAQQAVREILTTQGGHIQHSYFNNIEGNQYWEFTLRIPGTRFVQTMALLSELGRIRTSNTSEQDVTEEYMDLGARLRVLYQEEERLLDLLKLAVTIDDFLKVESNLSRVRVNIEQTTGRIKFLDDRIDYSTLALNLRPETGAVEPELKGFAGLGKRIRNGFREGINLLVDFVAGLLIFLAMSLPTLGPVILVLYLLYRLVRRVRRKPWNPTTTGKEPPISG